MAHTSADVNVHVISRADLAARNFPPTWNDPEGLAPADAQDLHILLGDTFSRDRSGPARILAVIGNEPVGRLSVFPGEFQLDGQPQTMLWGRNLVVSPNHRGKGIATRMVEKWETLCPTLGACGVGSYAKNIYHTRGWAEFAIPQYILPRRGGKVLQRFLRPRFLSAIAAPVADGVLGALGGTVRLRARRSTRGLTAVPCDLMSSEFDAALRRPRARVVTHRSAAWINWLLRGDATGRSEHRLFYAQDAQKRVVGYFLIRRTPWDFPTHGLHGVVFAGLKDWGIFDDQAADEVSIVMLAVGELLRWQADLVRIFTGDAATGRRLRRLGFIRRGALLSAYHVAPPSPLAPQEFRQPECWRTTGVEGDNYFNP